MNSEHFHVDGLGTSRRGWKSAAHKNRSRWVD